jgi:hypothetical protein
MAGVRLKSSLIIESQLSVPRLRCGANGQLARTCALISASAKAAH